MIHASHYVVKDARFAGGNSYASSDVDKMTSCASVPKLLGVAFEISYTMSPHVVITLASTASDAIIFH